MSRSVYLTAMGPASGKSIVAVGLVELFYDGRVASGSSDPSCSPLPDNDIELIRARDELAADQVGGFWFTAGELQALVCAATGGRRGWGWRRRSRAYKELAAGCDIVVIEGTDFTGPSSPLEFDFNALVLRAHLGAPCARRHQRPRSRCGSRSSSRCG